MNSSLPPPGLISPNTQTRLHPSSPSLSPFPKTSLRQLLSILYLEPTTRLFIMGNKIEMRNLVRDLHAPARYLFQTDAISGMRGVMTKNLEERLDTFKQREQAVRKGSERSKCIIE